MALPDKEKSTHRNIHVGKSWPRPATPCELAPAWEGEFRDYNDWVGFASKRLTVATSVVTGAQVPSICVDALGRRCTCGGDFMRARDEGTFPVRYFFECEVPPAPTPTDREARLLQVARDVAADELAEFYAQKGWSNSSTASICRHIRAGRCDNEREVRIALAALRLGDVS